MGMGTDSPSRRPPRFQHIDDIFDEPRQQSPLPIARDLFMDPHSPSTLFPRLSGSFFEPASAAPISQSFNPNIPVPNGPSTTSPSSTPIEFSDGSSAPRSSTPTQLIDCLDGNNPYLLDLAVNKDPGAPRPPPPYVEFLEKAKHDFARSNAHLSREELNCAWFQASCQTSQQDVNVISNTYVDFLEQAKHDFARSNTHLSREELNRVWFQAACQPSHPSMAHEVPRSMASNASDTTHLGTGSR
jgi:hypothetical protein